MDLLTQLLNALSATTPLGVAALALVILGMQIKHSRKLNKIETNDLHGLPEILETLQRIEVRLVEDLTYIKTRLNGKV